MLTGKRLNEMMSIVDSIKSIWMDFPELRFGQLIENIYNTKDKFYISDKETLNKIGEFKNV